MREEIIANQECIRHDKASGGFYLTGEAPRGRQNAECVG